jgi:hypothetical protein
VTGVIIRTTEEFKDLAKEKIIFIVYQHACLKTVMMETEISILSVSPTPSLAIIPQWMVPPQLIGLVHETSGSSMLVM